MEVDEQIRLFREFIEHNYYPQLLEAVRKGQAFLVIDFRELISFNTELAEETTENPVELLKAAELAIKEFDLPKKISKFAIRLKNLTESQKVQVNEIRSKHLNKLVLVEGIVRQKSDVRPHVTAAKFECPSCGNILNVLQLDKKYKEPTRCSCGRKGKFKEISKELVDGQGLVLEEAPDELDGAQAKRINVFLKDDLVSPISERKSSPGSRVRISGWVIEVPVILQRGGQATKYDLVIEANYSEPTQDEDVDRQITDEEMEKIKEIARQPDVSIILANSLAPSIYGHDKIKEALVLQLAGGCRKIRPDGMTTRGDMHLLLIGDPGSAKSQLLKCIAKVAPKARFTSGKGATAAGLCVAPDSLVLANPDLHVIKELVEKKIENNSAVHCPGVWKAKDSTNNHNVLALDEHFQIKPAAVSQFWKIKAPEQMREIHTRLGKKVTVTPNTALLTLRAGDLRWKKSKHFREGDFIATARRTVAESGAQVLTVSLLKSNPVVYGVKKVVAEMINELLKKNKSKNENKSKRALAKTLSWSENNLYHHWVKEKARGNITLRDFRKLVAASGYPLEKAAQEISGLSLYRGHRIKVPLYLNGELLYFAGLMAGDGDLSQGKNSVVIRFSNSSEELLHQFKQLAQELFGVPCNVSSIKSAQRPGSLRFGSKLVYEILSELGIPSSPKSPRIDISGTLWRLPNGLVKEYIKGLFDTDGSVVERKTGASYLDFTTTSEKLAMKLPLLLLRFGILAKVRSRKMGNTSRLKNGKFITPRHGKFTLEIKGKENLELFKTNIDFGYSNKRIKLARIIEKISKYDTNIDTIPTIQEKIKKIKQQYQLTSRQIFNYKRSTYDLAQRQFSRRHVLTILQRMKSSGVSEQNHDFRYLKSMAESDLFWDKIVQIKNVKPEYDYVYDLTMPDSQNFLVNGFIVHNTASVVKDEFLGGWSLEAGTLVLANRGFALIDEMDKMGKDDRSALHEAMEQQQVSISKANIQATLRCETTIIAAANPKFGRFDPYALVAEQIDLPPTLINRFDLIFPIKDLPSRERDEQMASFILKLHQNPEQAVAEIPPDLLRKYFSYIRQKVVPKMSDAAIEELKEYYITMRNSGTADGGGRKSIPITARQLEALVRLSEAAAKIRLAKTVSKKDAQKAIELVDYCLNQVAMDPQTGKIDIDRLGGTITATQRSGISIIKEIIGILEEQMGNKVLPVEAIMEAALTKNISKDQAEEILEKLRRSGDIFEPKRGFVQKL